MYLPPTFYATTPSVFGWGRYPLCHRPDCRRQTVHWWGMGQCRYPLRLDWPGGWLLVRGSNTEPIVRIIAEGEDEARVTAAIDRATAQLVGSSANT